MNDAHDDELGPELRDLPVPEHKPGFWERLERRLEAEDVVGDRSGDRQGRPAPALSALARYGPLIIAALIVLIIVVVVVL